MCGGPCGCVVVFFFGWIWIYGTWVFGVDLWWLLEKKLDVWWCWSPGFGCVVVVWMCGGLDLVVWWFSLLGGFGYIAPGFLVWICGGFLRKFYRPCKQAEAEENRRRR